MRGEEGEARGKPRTVVYMVRMMRPKKRVGVEGDGVEHRSGVLWKNDKRKYVVETSFPKKKNVKLHLGSYTSVNEANLARDYDAYFRNSTGKKDPASVGGFRNCPDHLGIFEFEESPAVFEGSGSGSRAQARCDEYKRLLELQTPDTFNAARKEFCKAAREDICVFIDLFRRRDPQRFPPGTPPPSSSEVGVSPTPGREVGISMGEQIDREIHTAAEILVDLRFDKWFEGLEPCRIKPETIPVFE